MLVGVNGRSWSPVLKLSLTLRVRNTFYSLLVVELWLIRLNHMVNLNNGIIISKRSVFLPVHTKMQRQSLLSNTGPAVLLRRSTLEYIDSRCKLVETIHFKTRIALSRANLNQGLTVPSNSIKLQLILHTHSDQSAKCAGFFSSRSIDYFLGNRK